MSGSMRAVAGGGDFEVLVAALLRNGKVSGLHGSDDARHWTRSRLNLIARTRRWQRATSGDEAATPISH
jgi:hypothetical protein